MNRRYLALGIWASVFVGLSFNAWGLSITTPSEMSVMEPGQTIPVRVDLADAVGVRRVQFYWYRTGEEPVPSKQAKAALVAGASSDPPLGGLVTVPVEAVGVLRLLAVAEIAGGRLAGREEFDEILLRVEPSSELIRIEFEAEKPLRLKAIGGVFEIPVVGQFADGVLRPIGGDSAGSSYRSSNEQVIKAYPNGLLRAVGNGRATVTVTNRGKKGALEVIVRGAVEANEWPIADAGPDVTVKSGRAVVLNGFRSMDPDGDPLRYQWTQIRGNKVSLLDPGTAKATFMAPKVSARRLLRFKLWVTDMEGPDTVKGADSLPAFVNIWVEP